MPNQLHFYTKYSKEKIKISDKPMASGGEGAIYAIASPRSYRHLVAKIFYPNKRTKEREQKMQYLLEHPPIHFTKGQHSSIGWVQDLVYKDNRFLGILLIKIAGKKLTKLTLAKLPRRADKAWQRFSFQDPNALQLRLRTCFNLAVAIYQIHKSEQYVLVDLKPDNILMQPNGLLAIVDMDSVEVIKDGKTIFSAPVATPEYTPPEHYTNPRTTIHETWDRFSLGVIFYQLLLGLHPFAASCHPPYDNLVGLHDKIQHHLYVHNADKKASFKVIPPPHQHYHQLPIPVQQLFQACFENGAKNPFDRPSALDWCSTLAELLELPFDIAADKVPKIDIPPSDLYFEPANYVPALDLNLDYTPLDIRIPSLPPIKEGLSNSLTHQYPKIGLNTQNRAYDLLLKAYQQSIQLQRNKLMMGLLLLCVLSGIIYFFQGLLLIGLILFCVISIHFFFVKNHDIIQAVGKTVSSKINHNLYVEHDALLRTKKQQELQHQQQVVKLHEKQKMLEQYLQQIQHTQNLVEPIKIGLIKQEKIKQEVAQFNHWIKSILKPILEKARQQEWSQKDAIRKQFVKQFKQIKSTGRQLEKDNTHHQFKSKKRIDLLKKELEQLNAEKSVSAQQLDEDYTQKIKQIHVDSFSQFKTHCDAINQQLAQDLKSLQQDLHPIAFNHPKYASYTQQQKILLSKLHKQMKKHLITKEKVLKAAKKKVGSKFNSQYKPALRLLATPLDGTALNFALFEYQKQYQKIQAAISKLGLSIPSVNAILLASAYNTQTSTPIVIEKASLGHTTNYTLRHRQKKIKSHYDSMMRAFDAVHKALDWLLQYPPLSEDSGFMEHWVDSVKEHLLTIEIDLEQYTELQTAFFSAAKIFQTATMMESYLYHQQAIDELKAAYEANLNKVVENLLPQETINRAKQEKKLQDECSQALNAYSQSWLQEKETSIQTLTQAYQEAQQKLQKDWEVKNEQLHQQLIQEQQHWEQLEKDYNDKQEALNQEETLLIKQYEEDLIAVQSKSEAVYDKYKQAYDKEYASLEQAFHQYAHSHQNTIHHIKNHKKEYKKGLVNLDKFKQQQVQLEKLGRALTSIEHKTLHTEEEKIKIETLIQWKESYRTKIYIKDLLFNRLEQLDNKQTDYKS